MATNRETSGDGYRRLVEAFERLAGTRITTNISTGGEIEETTGFGLIEAWQIQRRTRGGRMVSVKVSLADWLYRAVLAKSVLTLSRDYFRLRKPLERRIYELARKHCGHQPEWRVSLAVLAHKSGSASPIRVFRRMIRDMIAADHLPDYEISEAPGDIIHVRPRRVKLAPGEGPRPGPEALDEARRLMPWCGCLRARGRLARLVGRHRPIIVRHINNGARFCRESRVFEPRLRRCICTVSSPFRHEKLAFKRAPLTVHGVSYETF